MRKGTFLVLALAAALAGYASASVAPGPTSPNAAAAGRATAPTAPAAAQAPGRDDPDSWRVFAGPESTDAAQAQPAAAYGGATMRIVLSLAAVLAAVALCAWGFKRLAPRTTSMFASENLKVIARTHLGPKQAVYLVRAPGSLLVVAATQERITLLSQVTDAAQIEQALSEAHSASAKSISNSFRTLMSGVTEDAARDKDVRTVADLAIAVESVSDRFAKLNKRLETIEPKTD